MLALKPTICNIKPMCEFNRPYSFSNGHRMDGPRLNAPIQIEPVILPQSAWQKHLRELPPAEIETINQAEQEAAALQSDVHIYRKLGSQFIGIALRPGDGPTVKIWEH